MVIMCRDVKFDDVKHLLHMERSDGLGVLAAVAGIAKQIYDDHQSRLDKGKAPIIDGDDGGGGDRAPTSKKRKTTASKHGEKECSTSSTLAPKKRRRYIRINVQHQQTAPLPEAYSRMIQEIARGRRLTAPVRLVIEKELYDSDLNRGHGRLSFPMNQVLTHDFLTEWEKVYLNGYQDAAEKKRNVIEVSVIDPSLEVETAKICRWNMPKPNGKTSSIYAINGNWNNIVEKNNLVIGMKVQLWSFKVDDQLYFALVLI